MIGSSVLDTAQLGHDGAIPRQFRAKCLNLVYGMAD